MRNRIRFIAIRLFRCFSATRPIKQPIALPRIFREAYRGLFSARASHGYVLCDVTRDVFDVSMMRISPGAFEDSIDKTKAEISMKYRIISGDPEPRTA